LHFPGKLELSASMAVTAWSFFSGGSRVPFVWRHPFLDGRPRLGHTVSMCNRSTKKPWTRLTATTRTCPRTRGAPHQSRTATWWPCQQATRSTPPAKRILCFSPSVLSKSTRSLISVQKYLIWALFSSVLALVVFKNSMHRPNLRRNQF
jgi:hypothetical protein